MRREIITWSIVVGALVAAFAGTVLVLNSTLYSASGFVRGYLDSLARHDVDGALELAGTVVTGDASDELLTAAALGELTDLELVSDTAQPEGTHRVVYSFTADGRSGQSTFSVRPEGTLLGLFPTWGFESSPLGVLQVSPLHGTGFTVNGVEVTADAQDQPSPYLVFAPGSYELGSDSLYLKASPVTITASQPGAAVIGVVELHPTTEFLEQVQKEVDEYLDDCATQRVLLPTGCPFGEEISNRIVGTPEWSISAYPPVALQPGTEPGSWVMPATAGAARLVVDVRSLFDGLVTPFDQDVPFTSSYVVTFLGDNRLLIKVQ